MPEMDNASFQRDRDRLDPPDVPAILSYGPIGGELTHAGDIQDGHASPAFVVEVGLIDLLLDLHIGRKVREQLLIAVGEMARTDAFDGPL
jgi:hypothetical protein